MVEADVNLLLLPPMPISSTIPRMLVLVAHLVDEDDAGVTEAPGFKPIVEVFGNWANEAAVDNPIFGGRRPKN